MFFLALVVLVPNFGKLFGREVPLAPSTGRSPSPVPDTQVDAAVGPGRGRNLRATMEMECLEHVVTGCIAKTCKNISYELCELCAHMNVYHCDESNKAVSDRFFFAISAR